MSNRLSAPAFEAEDAQVVGIQPSDQLPQIHFEGSAQREHVGWDLEVPRASAERAVGDDPWQPGDTSA